MGRTLKIFNYRGVKVYIRWLGGMWYEFMFYFKGGIHVHQLQLIKPRNHERRNTIAERHDGATKELSIGATIRIDGLKEQTKVVNIIKNRLINNSKIIWQRMKKVWHGTQEQE